MESSRGYSPKDRDRFAHHGGRGQSGRPPDGGGGGHGQHRSTQLVVYNNNIENMVTCTGNDYKRLLDYMKSQPKAPDLFVVQQVSNQAKHSSCGK